MKTEQTSYFLMKAIRDEDKEDSKKLRKLAGMIIKFPDKINIPKEYLVGNIL